jgi:NmrA-like family
MNVRSTLPEVAIAGATGYLGNAIVKAFTQPSFSLYFSKITFFSRNADLDICGAATALIREHDLASLKAALEGVNVVVNAIGSRGCELRDLLVRAIADTPSVKVYFPFKFRVDHTLNDDEDSDFDHQEWNKKKVHTALARRLFGQKDRADVKMCHVIVGLITELAFGPWFGLDAGKRGFDAVGKAGQKTTWTSWFDIGKALASMGPKTVPESVRILGDVKRVRECASSMDEAIGDEEKIPLQKYKKRGSGTQHR